MQHAWHRVCTHSHTQASLVTDGKHALGTPGCLGVALALLWVWGAPSDRPLSRPKGNLDPDPEGAPNLKDKKLSFRKS